MPCFPCDLNKSAEILSIALEEFSSGWGTKLQVTSRGIEREEVGSKSLTIIRDTGPRRETAIESRDEGLLTDGERTGPGKAKEKIAMDQAATTIAHWMNDILTWIGFGTIVGLVAKGIMPGRDPGGRWRHC